MSEFEFLRDLPVGQYVPVDSPLHRLDPRTRIVTAILLLLALTFISSPLALGVGLLAALVGWWISRIPMGPMLRGWRAVLPFILILALLQVFFRAGPEGDPLFRIGGLVISTGDLQAALTLIMRFSAYIAVLGLASATLSASDITRGLESLLRPLLIVHFPVHDFVMVIQVTLRFFPLLAQTAERIAKAQASRGADWNAKGNLIQRVRQVLPILVPLFVTSLRRAENLALAMDARGYGSGPTRSSMVVLSFRWLDVAVIVLVIGVVVGMVLIAVQAV